MAAGTLAKRGRAVRLWGYNYRILIGTGYWVLVLPVASNMFVTLWMFALGTDFKQTTAMAIAEMMMPILGAFLVAHSMAPEYRSGIGAVLACKPVSLHRVVTMRGGLAMLAGILLTAATLFVCHFGLKPIRVWEPLAAALPGLWFLSMLALTFATLFRSALGGFAVAAALWALDLRMGFAVHPLLSLQGMAANDSGEPLARLWLWSKGALLATGTLLLFTHGRILPRVCRPPERKDIIRITATIAAVVLVYCWSGAFVTVAYAYLNRGRLITRDVVWLRRQLDVYGPVPVSRLFGPAFAVYTSRPPAQGGQLGAREMRIRQLEQAVERYPRSIWADGIAYALADERESVSPGAALKDYLNVAARHASSPFAPKALHRILVIASDEITPGDKLTAARQLLADYPNAPEAARAAHVMLDRYGDAVRAEEMLKAALVGAQVGFRHERPMWLVTAARMQRELGRLDEARETLRRARSEAEALQAEAMGTSPSRHELAPHRQVIDGALVESERMLKELGN